MAEEKKGKDYIVRNFRFIKVKGEDFIDSIISGSQIITIRDVDSGERFVYFEFSNSISRGYIDDLEGSIDFNRFCSSLSTDTKLIFGLISCADNEDEDALYDWIEEEGGKIIWPELSDNAADLIGGIGVITSEAVINGVINGVTITINGITTNIANSLGHYSEDDEWVVIYHNE